MGRNRSEWALGLYLHADGPPSASAYSEFFEFSVAAFAGLGVAPTFVAVEGEGFSGEYVKFRGRVKSKLEGADLGSVSVLALVSTPADSDAPAYDRIVSASLSFNAPGEVVLCFTCTEELCPFLSDTFELVLRRALKLRDWSYGLGFVGGVAARPDCHVLGIDPGDLSPRESRELNRWYNASDGDRESRFRGVYPISILNRDQLRSALPDGRSLDQYFDARDEVEQVEFDRLVLVRIPASSIDEIRAELEGTGVLLA